MTAHIDDKIGNICNALQTIILNIHLIKEDLQAQGIENPRLQIIHDCAKKIDTMLKELYNSPG